MVAYSWSGYFWRMEDRMNSSTSIGHSRQRRTQHARSSTRLTIVRLCHNVDRILLLHICDIRATSLPALHAPPRGGHEHVASILAQLHRKGVYLIEILITYSSHCVVVVLASGMTRATSRRSRGLRRDRMARQTPLTTVAVESRRALIGLITGCRSRVYGENGVVLRRSEGGCVA